ncbi:MAG: class F sortase [Candidatus Saccharimonadales bacterium]
MIKLPKIINRINVASALIAIGALGIGVSTYILINTPVPPKAVSEPKSISVNDAPSSVKPKPAVVASYSVPPSNPKYISIEAIGVKDVPIIKLGLLSSGAIATPDNIYEAGWYDSSSLPGQSGAMFIYGHVSSWQADGIFYNLKQLIPGDQVVITRGDNKTFTYVVVTSKIYQYNNVDMNQVLAPISSTIPGLNLMTCTGQVIKGTSEFNERLVVFTKLLS